MNCFNIKFNVTSSTLYTSSHYFSFKQSRKISVQNDDKNISSSSNNNRINRFNNASTCNNNSVVFEEVMKSTDVNINVM